MTLTFDEAKRRYEEKFPGNELLTYTKAREPCRIRCRIHGELEMPGFTSMMRTKWGCRLCGEAASLAAATARLSNSNLKPSTATILPWSSPDDLPQDEYTFVPFLKDVGLAAGCGTYVESTTKYQLPFGRSTLRRQGVDHTKAVCCTVDGDSMEPMLMDGTTVGINTADRDIKDGKVYAIVQDGLSRIKVLSREPGESLRIRSLNPAYPDEVVPAQEVEVVGKMFWSSTLY